MTRKRTQRERIARRLLWTSIFVSMIGAAFVVYWLYFRVVEVRIAVGNPNGEDAAILTSVNDWLVSEKRRHRLKIIPTGSPDASLEKLRLDEVEVVSLRGDRVNMAGVSSIMVMFYEVAGIVASEASGATEWAGLQKATIGVPRGTAPDDPLLITLLRLNGVPNPKIVSLETDAVRTALERRQVTAIGFVSPLPGYAATNFHLYFGPKSGTLGMPSVDDPDQLVAKDKRYASASIVAGSLRANPSVPDEAVGTLSVGRHLIVRNSTNGFLVAQFVRNLLDARRALFNAQPLFRQAGSPDTDADAFLKVHDAAKKIFNGDEPSWKDVAIEWIYIVPMIFGALGTIAVWGFQRYIVPNYRDPADIVSDLLDIRFSAREAGSEQELMKLRDEIDALADELTGEAYDYTDIEATGTVLTAMLIAEKHIAERRDELRDPACAWPKANKEDHEASTKVADALEKKLAEDNE